MSVRSSKGTINRAVRDLNVEWEECKTNWNDIKSKEFQQKYISTIPDTLSSCSNIIDELDKILNKLRKDCE